jgi:hypothetical protein
MNKALLILQLGLKLTTLILIKNYVTNYVLTHSQFIKGHGVLLGCRLNFRTHANYFLKKSLEIRKGLIHLCFLSYHR